MMKELFKDDPYFFEQVVVDLLEKMGYQGPNGHGITTQQTKIMVLTELSTKIR
ncbi:MAG: Hypothetical protein AJITA_00615 [Acetilactobacillus jinshanensis]